MKKSLSRFYIFFIKLFYLSYNIFTAQLSAIIESINYQKENQYEEVV